MHNCIWAIFFTFFQICFFSKTNNESENPFNYFWSFYIIIICITLNSNFIKERWMYIICMDILHIWLYIYKYLCMFIHIHMYSWNIFYVIYMCICVNINAFYVIYIKYKIILYIYIYFFINVYMCMYICIDI